MFLTNTKRILKSGWLTFKRNSWLSVATITVMVLVLFIFGSLIFLSAVTNSVLSSLEEKVDISIYFKREAEEEDILQVKNEIELFPEVEKVSYLSRNDALEQFRERHKNNALIADALTELGDNPLEASVNIKAKDPTQYAAISEFLLDKNYPMVDKINYFENQQVIEKFSAIVTTVRGVGALLAILLGFVAIMVAFNTIRLGIYTMRDEIGIMRLVGATNWFIRGPFIVNGLLYGSIAAIITTLVFLPLTWLIAPKLVLAVPNFNIYQYLLANFFEFLALMMAGGFILGVASSIVAVRRYLEV